MPIEPPEIIEVLRSVIDGRRKAVFETSWEMSPSLETNDGWIIGFWFRGLRKEVQFVKAPDGRKTDLPDENIDLDIGDALTHSELAILLPALGHA